MKKPRAKREADAMTKFDGLYEGDPEKIFEIFKKSSKQHAQLFKKATTGDTRVNPTLKMPLRERDAD